MIINIYNKAKKKLPFNKKKIKKIITKAALILKVKQNLELTVLIVNNQEIKKLNKKFRHKNKVTDVLSFGQKEGRQLILPPEGKNYLGDIIIAYAQVKRQAKALKTSGKKEFGLILVHGFLHLLGYEDESQASNLKMQKKQDYILAKIND
ncbi:MAG: rRNA maturation RNase YbeY [Candidatus Parcubacteria bacterium]|nr:rRNA maturation RNase YbeY [Candidatus Parcubacteria bacterium]